MTISVKTIEEGFAINTLDVELTEVEFWYHDILLATANGKLRTNMYGKLELVFLDRVSFLQQPDLNMIEVDGEIVIKAKAGSDFVVDGRPTNFSSFDFFLYTGEQPPISFRSLAFSPTSMTQNIYSVEGYVTSFPTTLVHADTAAVDRYFEYTGADFAIRGELRQQGCHVTIRGTDNRLLSELTAGAALYALSIMEGKQCSWKSMTQTDSNGLQKLTLYSQEIRTTNFFAPLFLTPFDAAWNEQVFLKVHKYLCENTDSVVVRMFGMLWASSGKDFDARAVLLGIAIEGVAKSIKLVTREATEFEQYKSRVMSVLEPFKSGNDKIEGLAEGDIARIVGMLANASNYTTGEQLEHASKQVGFDISPAQIKAWGKVRNKRGHGTFGFFPTEEDWLIYMTCVDVFNYLCLHIMDFSEPKAFKRWLHPLLSPAAEALQKQTPKQQSVKDRPR